MKAICFIALSIGLGSVALFGQDMPLTQVLIDGEPWQEVAGGYQFTDAMTVDGEGNVYFTDVLGGTTINRISPDGTLSVVAEDAPRISGMQFGPDGRLYACQGGQFGRIVAFDLDGGSMEVIATGFKPNDLVVTHRGDIYVTETPKKQITLIRRGGKPVVADKASDTSGAQRPNGIALTPDQGTLAVSDAGGRHTWVWRIEPDGELSHRQPYITLRTRKPDLRSRGDGMTTDVQGRYYVTSEVGLQMFDPTGRMGGVIAKPSGKAITSVTFGGPELAYLYVAATDKVFRRKTKTRGFVNFHAPQDAR